MKYDSPKGAPVSFKPFFNLILGLVFIAGCSNPSGTDNTAKTVTFNVQIDQKVFSTKRDLEARIFNEEQKKILDTTAGCSVSFDPASQKETVNCPAGVVYQKPNPEVFTFKIADIKDSVTMKSTTVKTGQKYLLTLSGLSSDNCNTASARVEKTAAAEQENIKDLQWATTELGCLP
jgi:hypothetical protein